MRFREDILRGVRLFAIVFAAILVGVAAYRIFRAPSDVQGAGSSAEAAPPASQPDTAPAAEAAPEAHPLIVPDAPPVPGSKPVQTRVTHPAAHTGPALNGDVPPPPPVVPAAPTSRARRAPAPREFESSDTIPLPAAPVEEAPEAKPMTPQQAVGYKSLIEANKNRPPAEPVLAPVPADDPTPAPPAKGNRFFRAVGKMFGGKKDPDPKP